MMIISIAVLLLTLSAVSCTDFTYYVKEEKSPGTLVGDIAVDAHLKGYPSPVTHPDVRFSLEQPSTKNGSEFFTLSSINKKLYTSKTLDADTLCTRKVDCYLLVGIEISDAGSLVKTLDIKVIVEDENDNGPEFPENRIEVEFSEKDSVGTRRAVPYATDRDVSAPNSLIKYQLVKDRGDPFDLSASYLEDDKSELNIYLQEKLDRETKSSYKVQIVAKDQGSPPRQATLDVHIAVTDWNDNLPVFSQNVYNVTIGQEENRDIPIAVVKATDPDEGRGGKVTYRISSQTSKTARSLFRIDRETGEIFLQKELDPNRNASYRLFVKASDGGRSRHAALGVVNVNVVVSTNHAPKIEANFISGSTKKMAVISEGAEIGSFIAYVKVTDNDPGQNGEVICDLRHSHFQLQNMGVKKYKVTVRSLIDREVRSLYEITIICRDKGSPPLQGELKLSVRISDVNDVRPTFTQKTYTFQIYENQKSHIPIGFVNATDPDLGPGGEVSFSLLKNSKTLLPFRIADGAIIMVTRSLDRESKDTYRFKVLARDNGRPSLNDTATIIVKVLDENDNAPRFTFPEFNPFHLDVFYPVPHRNITILKAIDLDTKENGRLSFKIISGNYRNVFSVDRLSGQLFFTRTPSANDSGTYQLLLLVRDGGIPSLSSKTNLTLDLLVEDGSTGTLSAVQITRDFSLALNSRMVTALLVTVGTLSLALIVLILILRMHQLRALCSVRGSGTRSGENDDGRGGDGGNGERALDKMTKKASSWTDISLDLKLQPFVSEETLERKSGDETETDYYKKGSFTSDENMQTTSEYDDPMTVLETNLSDPSDEDQLAKSSDTCGLDPNMLARFSSGSDDEKLKSSGKFKNMRQVLNPNYYTSECLVSRNEQPNYTDVDLLHQANKHPGENNTDMLQEHKALIHDDQHYPQHVVRGSQKHDAHSPNTNTTSMDKKQTPTQKQQSKIPYLPQLRYQVLKNPPNEIKQSSLTTKPNPKMGRRMSEQSNSSTSSQNSFSDEPGPGPLKKTLAPARHSERPRCEEGLPKFHQELPPFKPPPVLTRRFKGHNSESLASYPHPSNNPLPPPPPASERPSIGFQSQIPSSRKSPSQIPVLRQVTESPNQSVPQAKTPFDTQQPIDSRDPKRVPKSATKLFQSKIPSPPSRIQVHPKQTPNCPEIQPLDQTQVSRLPMSEIRHHQGQYNDETKRVPQRQKFGDIPQKWHHKQDLISQESNNYGYSQIEPPGNYPEWLGQLEAQNKVMSSTGIGPSENPKMSTSFINSRDLQYYQGSEKLLHMLKPDAV